jgi:hypothetical protein
MRRPFTSWLALRHMLGSSTIASGFELVCCLGGARTLCTTKLFDLGVLLANLERLGPALCLCGANDLCMAGVVVCQLFPAYNVITVVICSN